MTQPGWIDFKELRMKLKFSEVFKHFNVEVRVKGDRASGFCPLPTHQGKRCSPSFSVDLIRGIWQCFGCHAKGNVLDFAVRMSGFDPQDPKQLRVGALKVRDIFFADGVSGQEPRKKPAARSTDTRPVLVNAPIDFELQSLDPEHPYLKERGFTPETIKHFGLGFTNKGMLKNRVAIPLHDPKGQLVGYAGRITKDDLISEKCPKYRFPGERERNGTVLSFKKSLLLYNAHRITAPVDHLFVVEGFPACWWLWQHEYRNVAALMGSSCSPEQTKLIVDLVKSDGKVWLMPDGNDAGVRCARSLLELVSPHRLVRWVRLENNVQPTDLGVHEIITALN